MTMREIKFRAWDKFSNEMINVKTIDFGPRGAECAVDYSNINGDLKGEWVLEQYTGLKDKNGVEIYEGDIVELEYESGRHTIMDSQTLGMVDQWVDIETTLRGRVRIWPSKGVVLTNIVVGNPEQFADAQQTPPQWLHVTKCHLVAGNIHENPELLKETK